MEILDELLNSIAQYSVTPIGVGFSLIVLLGIATFLFCAYRRIALRVNIGDYAATLYVLVLLFTLMVSKARPNTVHFISPYASALCLYFAVRLLSRWPAATTKLLLRSFVALGLILVLANLALQIDSISATMRNFPASSLTSFRASLPLVGMSTKNDELAIVLCILPYALVGATSKRRANRYFWIVGTLTSAGLVSVLTLSFSRSVYCALALLMISLLILTTYTRAISFRRLGIVLAFLCVFTTTVVVCLGAQRAVLQTVRINETASQERSTLGHLQIWRGTVSTIVKHPLLGIGGGTDGIIALEKMGHSTLPFVAFNCNAPLDVLVSSGIVGLLFYGTFFASPLVMACRALLTSRERRQLPMIPMILSAGLIGMIFRDMTYSSLVLNGPTIVFAWITAALIHNTNPRAYPINKLHKSSGFIVILFTAIAMSALSLFLSIRLDLAERTYAQGGAALKGGRYSEAHAKFRNAIRLEPRQPMFYAADALTSATEALRSPLSEGFPRSLARLTWSEDGMLSAAGNDYRQSLRLAENDSTDWSNLAWVEAFQRCPDTALHSFEHAIEANSNDSSSRIGLGLLYEREGLEKQALEQYMYAIAASPQIVDSEFFDELLTRNPAIANASVVKSLELISGGSMTPIKFALLGKLHMFVGNATLARDEFVKALDLLPNLSYTWANLGKLDLMEGNRGSARSELERALFLDEGNRVALNTLASMDLEDGAMIDAKNLYGKSLLMPLRSEHSELVWRIYGVEAPAQDDLVPSGFLSYISPKIQPLAICDLDWLSSLGDSSAHPPDVGGRIVAQYAFCHLSK